MTVRIIVLLGLAGSSIASCAQQEGKSIESSQSGSSEAPAEPEPVESEVIKVDIDPDSPVRTTMVLTRAGGIAGLHEALSISPGGKVGGVWMSTSYDSELNTDQIEKIGSALEASGLFKRRVLPKLPADSDLIWVSIRYNGMIATWDELLAPSEAQKLVAEIAAVLELVK